MYQACEQWLNHGHSWLVSLFLHKHLGMTKRCATDFEILAVPEFGLTFDSPMSGRASLTNCGTAFLALGGDDTVTCNLKASVC